MLLFLPLNHCRINSGNRASMQVIPKLRSLKTLYSMCDIDCPKVVYDFKEVSIITKCETDLSSMLHSVKRLFTIL